MTTWGSPYAIDWSSDGYVCTKDKGDRLYSRDNYLRDHIVGASGHTHADGDGAELCVATATFRGFFVHWVKKQSIAAGGSTATFYLTADQTSGTSGVFTKCPLWFVLRGADTATADCRGVGHDNSGTYHYTAQISYNSGSGRWEIVVTNNDPSNAYTFWVIAEGS